MIKACIGVFGGICGLMTMAGCHRASSAPTTVIAHLDKGTTVHLVLLKQLQSGGQAGESVPLMVDQDVADGNGRVVIPKGALAFGQVSATRKEGTLGAVLNQPARLAITVDEVGTGEGTSAPITVDPDGKAGEPFQLDRGNTGKPAVADALDEVAKTPEGREFLSQITDAFQNGRTPDFGDSPQTKEVLKQLAGKLNLTNTDRLLRKNEVKRATDLLSQIRQGSTATRLLAGSSLTTVGAVLELATIAGGAGQRLGKMVQGRNITAYVGTPIVAQLTQPVTLTLTAYPADTKQ